MDSGVRDPRELPRLFAERASAGDVEGLLALYEDGAAFLAPDGRTARDRAALREQFRALLSGRPRLTATAARAVIAGDIALMSSGWRLSFGDQRSRGAGAHAAVAEIEGASSEVARRQTDGSWRYVIDAPAGASTAHP